MLEIQHGKPSKWKHHKLTKWIGSTCENYLWAANHALALCKEYTYRYEKRHSWQSKIENLLTLTPSVSIIEFTPPPLCMPEDCWCNDHVEAYREYYRKYKQHLFKWKKRGEPVWLRHVSN